MIVVFVLGYLAIALEHPIKIDKAASALIIGVLGWVLFSFSGVPIDAVEKELAHHLAEIAEILFFLLGAMTIVELIDAHEGFKIITDKINTRSKVKLMWILSAITFFFSATLDNLTTSIVLAALLTKIIKDKETLWLFAGIIILAANAGGAWSPIGDVTTIMLWIGGQVTAGNIITSLLIPSLVCAIVPLIYLTFKLNGEVESPLVSETKEHYLDPTTPFERNLVFYTGVGGLLFVPIFKIVIHLPPYLGMLFSLGILWIITEIIHRSKNHEQKARVSVVSVLRKIDTPTILFFLGILLAVTSLQSAGHLGLLAGFLQENLHGDIYAINLIIGLLSAIVDNVPLVAGAMGMYEIGDIGGEVLAYPVDHKFWEFLAYCAGTGGSVLIIGSAAGVAVMGILKVDFIWYVKKISFIALLGYFAGAMTYYAQEEFFGNNLNQKEVHHQESSTKHKNTITYK